MTTRAVKELTKEDRISTQSVGARRELFVASDLMRRGYQVFRNLSPNGIDLVAYKSGELIRVEVATGSRRADGTIGYPDKGYRYEFDVIAIVVSDNEIHYIDRERYDAEMEPKRVRLSQPDPESVSVPCCEMKLITRDP